MTLPRRDASSPGQAGAYAAFILIGWCGLFIPSLLRVIKDEFQRTDAEFAAVYFVFALLFATGALSSGLIADRVGRRVVLPAGALAMAAGMSLEGVAPTWGIFVLGAALTGVGSGAADAVGTSVIMDLSPPGSGRALNRLHLFYSVGALAAPLAIGTLLAVGVDWRAIALATGLAGLGLTFPLARLGSVPARARADTTTELGRTSALTFGLQLALVALGVAIACYVAAESGVSSWLVGFLADEPMTVATLALGLFWAGIAAGRLVASRVADRFDAVRFTTACALLGGIAIVAAVFATTGLVRVGLFLVAGFAFGPVYPMIMAVAGSLFPHRAAAVAGIITAAGVAGSITYPPFMGLIAGAAGLRAGMLGAALLIVLTGVTVVLAGRLAGRTRGRREPDPVRAAPA